MTEFNIGDTVRLKGNTHVTMVVDNYPVRPASMGFPPDTMLVGVVWADMRGFIQRTSLPTYVLERVGAS